MSWNAAGRFQTPATDRSQQRLEELFPLACQCTVEAAVPYRHFRFDCTLLKYADAVVGCEIGQPPWGSLQELLDQGAWGRLK